MGRPRKKPEPPSIDEQLAAVKTSSAKQVRQKNTKPTPQFEPGHKIVYSNPPRSEESKQYDGLRLKELRMLARKNGLRGWNKRTKAGLVRLLRSKGIAPILIVICLITTAYSQSSTLSSRITTRRNQGQEIQAAIEERADPGGTVAITGAWTFTSGFSLATNSAFQWADGGSVVLATAGTDVACANGARWWTQIQLHENKTLTGIFYLIGSVGGTDSVVVDLYNSAGTLVASSYSGATGAAAIVGTAANIQKVAFTSTYAATAGTYYISLQFNGTTAKFRAYPIPGSAFVAATAAGTYRTAAAITPGTTFTADKGPISGVY